MCIIGDYVNLNRSGCGHSPQQGRKFCGLKPELSQRSCGMLVFVGILKLLVLQKHASLPQASSAGASLQGKVEKLMATPPTKNQHFAISAAMQDPKTAGKEQLLEKNMRTDSLTQLAYTCSRVYEH